jgi:hypothetical protein
MKRIVQIALLVVAATSLAYGQSAAKDPKSSDEQTITKMEQDWGVALVKRDMAVIDRLEAPEYMYSAPDGSISNRVENDNDLKTGVVVIESFKLDDLKVRVFGDTAVAYGLETEKSTYKGKDTSGQYRFTDVFVRRNGAWQAVATHASKVEKH